jgi:A/G-specific adenine glycosylase
VTGAAAARNRALLDWYRVDGRTLPWRSTTDPWAILVSEVMLQQTQVARVVPVYGRFLRRFPSASSLADSERAAIVAAWEDLGYLRRVFYLQRAASVIATDGWPPPDELGTLPGVGPYTAAAVAVFAFGAHGPAIDVNLRRVLSRWAGSPLSGDGLAEAARQALGDAPASDWNQAVMDLAATTCRPTRPACESCPVDRWCSNPDVGIPLRRQPAFEGSVRQARAAILKALAAEGSLPIRAIPDRLHLDPARVERALERLSGEGLIHLDGEVVRLR